MSTERRVGTVSRGIRCPIFREGDDLGSQVVDSVLEAAESERAARLLDMEQARELYKIMGQKFVRKQGWSYSIITPDDNFEQYFGSKSDKRRKLYNGMIKCQLHMYFR